MSTLDNLKASVTALSTSVEAANLKIDALIALAQSAGIPQTDIDSVQSVVDASVASLNAEVAKIPA